LRETSRITVLKGFEDVRCGEFECGRKKYQDVKLQWGHFYWQGLPSDPCSFRAALSKRSSRNQTTRQPDIIIDVTFYHFIMFTRARPRIRPFKIWKIQTSRGTRQFASQSASASSNAAASQGQPTFGAFGGLIQELDKLSPRFEVKPGQIEILKNPAEFYETLKVGFELHMLVDRF